jgi:hypothetical protein
LIFVSKRWLLERLKKGGRLVRAEEQALSFNNFGSRKFFSQILFVQSDARTLKI